jgi:hypothetical protein
LIGQFAKAVDYGMMQLSVNKAPLGAPIDFFNTGVVPTGEVTLGEVTLEAGEHCLRIEVTGANEQAVKAYMFGLDYLRLVPR